MTRVDSHPAVSDDDFDDELEERCEMCDARINPASGDDLECSICHLPGCPRCLHRGDDVYPYLCSECDGCWEGDG